jgi:hypothetical protein
LLDEILPNQTMQSFEREDLGDRPDQFDGVRGYKPIGGLRARDRYDTDLEDTDQRQVGRRRHFSQHELLSGDWLFTVDNDLPLTLSSNTGLWDQIRQLPAITKICPDCASFRILSQPPEVDVQKLAVDLGQLRRVAGSCDLCNFFLQCLGPDDFDSINEIEILRDCSVLKLDKHSPPFIIILGDPGE